MFKKKLLSSGLVIALAFSMAGCDADNTGTDNRSEVINIETNTDSSKETNQENLDLWNDPDVESKIDEINTYIDNYYYFPKDKETQEEALYDGIMEGLDDPYSVYYTEQEYLDLQETNSGTYFGIGAVVTQDEEDTVSVVRIIPGSPAEEAGVMAGDIFVEIDGEEVTNQDLNLVVDMIRGEEGTTAHIRFYRASINDFIEMDIERRDVENISVNPSVTENNGHKYGYIQVTEFKENTGDEFEAAIDDLSDQGVEGFIIDLRDNPGGLLDVVVDMCNYILSDGRIVTVKDKNGDVISKFDADGKHSVSLPMTVLINGNSASASEIFTGAMQDTKTAAIIGTQSFGKGIVQSVIPLSDGSAIKITIAKYFTPNDNDIHKKGITPDYEVELPDEVTTPGALEEGQEDTQLSKAYEVLEGMLK